MYGEDLVSFGLYKFCTQMMRRFLASCDGSIFSIIQPTILPQFHILNNSEQCFPNTKSIPHNCTKQSQQLATTRIFFHTPFLTMPHNIRSTHPQEPTTLSDNTSICHQRTPQENHPQQPLSANWHHLQHNLILMMMMHHNTLKRSTGQMI